jgi:CHAT domain-containing protein
MERRGRRGRSGPSKRIRRSWPALALLAAVCLGFGVRCAPPVPGEAFEGASLPGRAELAKAWTGPKPYEGFLAGLPLEVGEGGARPGNLEQVAEIAREIEEAAAGGESSAAVLADLAAVDLLVGDAGLAVDRLEKAVSQAPPQEEAIFLSDLAAACLTRARESENPELDFLCAHQKASQALKSEPRLREAWCNRALASEGLGLKRQALASWKVCWDGSEEGPFGREQVYPGLIRNRLIAIRATQIRTRIEQAAWSGDMASLEKAVAASPWEARRLGEEALRRWAAAVLEGSQQLAAEALLLAQQLGDVLARLGGDALVRDTAARIVAVSNELQRQRTARGIDGCGRGERFDDAAHYHEASREYAIARRELEAAASPYRLRAAYGLALSDGNLGREQRGAALGALREIEREARRRGYGGLVAESLWVHGNFAETPAGTLAAYQGALEAFQAMGDQDGVAGVTNLLSETLAGLGVLSDAWRYRQAVLIQADRITSPKRLFQIYIIAATAAFREGWPEVALDFQNEAVRAAREVSAQALSEALLWRGRCHRSLGQTAAGKADLASAWATAARISDVSARERVESDLLLVEAEWVLERSPQRTVDLLSQAFARFERLGHTAHRLDALVLRARAYRALGDNLRAGWDLAAAEDAVEQWRAELSRDAFQISFLDTVQAVYDELILLHAEGFEDPEAALDALERKRARVFLDQLHARSSAGGEGGMPSGRPRPVEEWAPGLPKGQVLLSYSRIGDRVLVWVVDRSGVKGFRILDGAPEMAAATQGILSAAQAGPAAARPVTAEAHELYDFLIRPVTPFLPKGVKVVVARDDFLAALPFALLRDRSTGRYLLEEHALVTVASANCYLASQSRARPRRESRSETALFVGNPRFDRSAFRQLVDLPDSFSEAQAAAALYPGAATILTAGEATAPAFLAEAGRHEVVQFSGHAVRDTRSGGEPALVLAPSPGRDGRLGTEEIEKLELSFTRVVVLSACASAGGPASRSEGSRSLARAFLAAGAEAVVGSLWDIEDQSSKILLVEFHRQLRQGLDPAAALQAAQIHLLREGPSAGRSSLIWAAFEMSAAAQ